MRRDLTELEARGLLKRMHGGAAIINQATRDHVTSVREEINAAEKARIGAAVAELVVDGDAVAIDSGTTSLQAAKHLAGRPSLTFVTNGTDTLSQLVAAGCNDVHFIGGKYIEINRSLDGPMAVDAVRRFSVDKVILSVAAVDLKRGVIATTGPDIGAVQAAMIEIAHLSAIDHIVTDEKTRPLVAFLSSELQAKFIFV